jgi:SHS2 domain-containing protein
MTKGWEHFDHQADIGIRGHGNTLAEAFEQAAVALIAVITPPERVRPRDPVIIRCEAPDQEMLLADWLNAILREMSVLKMIFSRFEVRIEAGRLEACLWGEPLDDPRHEPAVEVKGASYHDLRVEQDGQGVWTAQCVVDV